MFWRAAAPIVRIRVGCFGQRAVKPEVIPRKTSSVFIAAIAAGNPATRFVAKNSDARSRELSTADFQFHRCSRYLYGCRRSSRKACLTVRCVAL